VKAHRANRRRYRIVESGDALTITIPAKRMWGMMILLPPWLVVWFWTEVMLLGLIGRSPVGWGLALLLIFSIIWTLCGLAAIYGMLWSMVGKEIVSFSAASLRIEKRTLVFREAREYPTVDVSALRVPSGLTSSDRSAGTIAFNCSGKAVRFGVNLDDGEAKQILDRVAGTWPRLFDERREDGEAVDSHRAARPAEVPGVPGLLAAAKRHPKLTVFMAPLAVWCLLCWLSFLVAILISFVGSPGWLPVPWCTPWDFVEAADGRVYVDIPMYARVLCYDREGRFVASYPHPFHAKGTRLAAGSNGLVYFRGVNKIHAMSDHWKTVWHVQEDWRRPGTWRMGENGKPVFLPGRDYKSRAPSKAISPGELLYTEYWGWWERTEFLCTGGSVLRRKGNSLEKTSADGRVMARYGSHWLFAPFVFPWPASLAWAILFVFISCWIVKARLAGRERQQRITAG